MKSFSTLYQELYQECHDSLESLRKEALKKRITLFIILFLICILIFFVSTTAFTFALFISILISALVPFSNKYKKQYDYVKQNKVLAKIIQICGNDEKMVLTFPNMKIKDKDENISLISGKNQVKMKNPIVITPAII